MNEVLLAVGLLCLGLGVGASWVARLTFRLSVTIKRSTIAAASGVVEIAGKARALEGAPTRDAEGVPCIWHRVYIESLDGDTRWLEDETPRDPAKHDTILLDDGTGACAMVIGTQDHKFLRDAQRQKLPSGMYRVTMRIREGTPLYAVGRVERLPRPERGATHRIEWDRSLPTGYSTRSIATMAGDLPRLIKIAVGLLLVGSASTAWALWHIFGLDGS